MKNFIARGDVLTVTNTTGADISSGDGVLLGVMFGVAANNIPQNEDGPINLTGVFELPKAASQAWTVGAAVYWNGTDKFATTAASGNTKIGVAAAPVAGGAGNTLGRVRLNGSF